MSNEWVNEQLVEIADVLMGQSPPSSTYNQEGNGLPFFQGKAEFGDIYPVATKYCSRPLRVAEPNDILLSVRAPVGPVNLSPSKCCIGRGLSAIRGKKHKIDQLYLFYYLRSIEARLSERGQGSTLGAIGRNDLEKIEVPHPINLDAQHRLASALQKAHGIAQKREEVNQLASKIIQSVFLKMFGDPVSNSFRFPTTTLGDLAVMSRYGPRFYNQPYSESGVPILRTTDITEEGDLSLENAPKLDVEAEDLVRYRLRKGDVVISRSGSLGRCAVFDSDGVDCIPGAFLLHFRFGEDVLPEYIHHYILTPGIQTRIREMGRVVAQPNVNAKELKSLNVPVPPIDSQRKFIETKSLFRRLKQSQMKSTREISELYQSIMQKAFRGELLRMSESGASAS
jgi:type I restriction enzyme S subunit